MVKLKSENMKRSTFFGLDSSSLNTVISDKEQNPKDITGLKVGVCLYPLKSKYEGKTCLYAIESYVLEETEEPIELLLSDNFMILIVGLKILFHSITNNEFYRHVNKANLIRRFRNNTLVEPLKFTLINVEDFFNPTNLKHGLKVRNVSVHDMAILDKNELRPDMIQISFSNLSIVWDLDENKEVSYVENVT